MLPQDQFNSTSQLNAQLNTWKGGFGDRYIERNEFEDWKMAPGTEAFRRMLASAKAESILEVGCNIGLNLIFIQNLFNGKIKLNAVEPNKTAYNKLISQPGLNLERSWNCDGFHIPLPDASMDLVFTNGVLIHIHPDNLGRITDEITRVSKRYVLCSEYFSHEPVELPYHGKKGLLFKRDFGSFYLDRFSGLQCIDYGFIWMKEFQIFDNLNWWLFEKTG
jgi:pseudaminic acid biosynthesis-associated methylase